MSLETYQAKRDFKRTPEPSGRKAGRARKGKVLHFVVQKHAATQLHYDFRLEMEGVLKSWAVPKGFPMRRGDRRLAIQVEDHPLDYADFEGTIAEGNYGAGTVMVWDRGDYEEREGDPARALEEGKLHLRLEGTKLNGDWTMVRMRPGRGGKAQWLLMKSGEELPPLSARAEDESVLTGRSLEEIGSGSAGRDRHKGKRTLADRKPVVVSETQSGVELPAETRRMPKAKPRFVEPMKCLLVEKLPEGKDWIYEIKFDGVRTLAIKDGRKLTLMSRSGKNLNAKYPEIAEAAAQLPCRGGVVDGEIVAVDEEGRSDFQLLQDYQMAGRKKPPIFYYVFDLLHLDGKDLMGMRLVERKEMLKALVADAPPEVRLSGNIQADSTKVLREMKARGLEGLVAKRKVSRYEAGRRSGAWVKFKWSHEQEFVIGGYTPPQGSRLFFGAILVGYYENGKLMFASKVGTGFNRELLGSLYNQFQKLKRSTCPFANLPTPRTEEGSLGVTAAQMKRCTWLTPKLVGQIRFAEWTRDGHLRQPVFLGLRDDKEPMEVGRERV